MKKINVLLAVVVVSCFVLGGCSSYLPNGSIYTSVKGPISSAGPVTFSKEGRATCRQTALGLVATGDCSIATAAKNGAIKNIKYVDWEMESILGFGTYTTVVYGD